LQRISTQHQSDIRPSTSQERRPGSEVAWPAPRVGEVMNEPLAASRSSVPDAKRPSSGRALASTSRQRSGSKRRRVDRTREEYRAFLWRSILAYQRRIETGGVEVLADVVALRDAFDAVIHCGVEVCRSELWSASWGEIAAATRMTREAAQERWTALGGACKPGTSGRG
jgi:hypothetical protein